MNLTLPGRPAARAPAHLSGNNVEQRRVRSICLVIFGLLAGLPSASSAQDYGNFAGDYAKLVSQASDVTMLDTELFGDKESLYTGGLSFSNTDVSLSGVGFPVSITRTYTVADRGSQDYWAAGAFGDWELQLPRLYGVFGQVLDTSTARKTGWNADGSDKRCSFPTGVMSAAPAMIDLQGGDFDATEYWLGTTFVAPGGGSQELMFFNSSVNPNYPSSGGPFHWVTNDQWFFSCITTLANGYPGEGFLAKGPDGTEITFDHMAKRPYEALSRVYGYSGGFRPVGEFSIAFREEVSLLPTKMTDRFGNVLTFIYDANVPGRLVKLKASDAQATDLRTLTLSYDTNGRIWKISDGARDWKYYYSASGSLTQVTLPDQTTWKYSFEALTQYQSQYPHSNENDVCNNAPPKNTGNAQGTVTHPSGAVGTFTIDSKSHARSYVKKMCIVDSGGDPNDPNDNSMHALYPRTIQTPTIASKQISGVGVAPMLWTYTYDSDNPGSWDTCDASCAATTWTQVRGPGGLQQIFTFGNRFRTDEGRLYRTQTSQVTGSGSSEVVKLLSDEQTTLVTAATGQPYPAKVGESINQRGDWMGQLLNPVKERVLSQQGVTFTRTNITFDEFANPKSVTRKSTNSDGGNFSRTEVTSYYHNKPKWILGQVESVKVGAKFVSRTVFDDDTALPMEIYSFEALQQSLDFNPNGTLDSVKDGGGHLTKLENWRRGTPQKITFKDSQAVVLGTISGVVDSFGFLTSATNELGDKTSYSYDPMGRLELTAYPSSQGETWNPETRDFSPVSAGDDRPVGYWKRVVATGNGSATTYYDALWRPVLTRTEDTAVSSSKSYVVMRYDDTGRLAFSSYPVATLTEANAAPAARKADGSLVLGGVHTYYDALGRVTSVVQDSDGGAELTTTNDYQAGFKLKTTNPRGYSTTTSYQVFDAPDTSHPVKIEAPEGVTTTILRDTFGKPLQVTRSGRGG